jgi:phosphoribosylamine--glycine ligase/phosphoribosylglycinamide formyltransferase/phosphoribosylformylglycinamidine cyclo-ligase
MKIHLLLEKSNLYLEVCICIYIYEDKEKDYNQFYYTDSPRVLVKNFANAFAPVMKPHIERASLRVKRRVGVLISGSGTNLQAIINHVQDPTVGSLAELALVISNKDGVKGLKRAERAGIATKVVMHKNFPTREEFDMELLRLLQAADVEFVVLAGFMRILSSVFVNSYRGRLINIHPALLPSFKGIHAHQQALDAGVRITGCSVHFVEVCFD